MLKTSPELAVFSSALDFAFFQDFAYVAYIPPPWIPARAYTFNKPTNVQNGSIYPVKKANKTDDCSTSIPRLWLGVCKGVFTPMMVTSTYPFRQVSQYCRLLVDLAEVGVRKNW
jgi:hypothetical protein